MERVAKTEPCPTQPGKDIPREISGKMLVSTVSQAGSLQQPGRLPRKVKILPWHGQSQLIVFRTVSDRV